MNRKKRVGLLFLIILLLVTFILLGRGGSNINPRRAVRNFSRIVERGNLDHLTLTIYLRYISTTRFPVSGEELVRLGWYDHKIVVMGSELEKHIELLEQISADNLIPVIPDLSINALLYYVFEFRGRKIFGFVPQLADEDLSMIINDVEFEWDDAFFDVIKPFLPEGSMWFWTD